MDEPITFAKYTVRDASLIGPAAGEGLCPLGMLSKGRIAWWSRRRNASDTSAVIIYHKGQRLGAARLLDAVANGLKRRKEEQ